MVAKNEIRKVLMKVPNKISYDDLTELVGRLAVAGSVREIYVLLVIYGYAIWPLPMIETIAADICRILEIVPEETFLTVKYVYDYVHDNPQLLQTLERGRSTFGM